MKKVALFTGLAGRDCWSYRLNILTENNYQCQILPDILTDKIQIKKSLVEKIHEFDFIILHSMSSYLAILDNFPVHKTIMFDPNLSVDFHSMTFKLATNNENYSKKLMSVIYLNSICLCGHCSKSLIVADILKYINVSKIINTDWFEKKLVKIIEKEKIPLLLSKGSKIELRTTKNMVEESIDHMAMITNPNKFEHCIQKLSRW